MASNASKKAAETQSKAADRAMAENRAVYQDQRSLMAPYVQGGQSAMGTLNRLMTPGDGARYASAPLPQLGSGPMPGMGAGPRPQGRSQMPGMGQGPAPQAQSMAPRMGSGPMPMGQGAAPRMGAGPMPGMGQQPGLMAPGPGPAMAGQGGPSFGGAGTVAMRSPSGQVAHVQAHLVPQFEARGAVRVQ